MIWDMVYVRVIGCGNDLGDNSNVVVITGCGSDMNYGSSSG